MIIVGIAKSPEEKNSCYQLRYGEYLKLGRVKPNESLTLSDDLDKNSVIFFGKHENQVCGTMRITCDDGVDFLVDHLFRDEVNTVRNESTSPVYEISRAAIMKEKSSFIMFGLLNAIYSFSLKSGIADFVAQCHPDDVSIYKKVGFCSIGDKRFYQSVNDWAVLLRWNISSTEEKYKRMFEKERFVTLNL